MNIPAATKIDRPTLKRAQALTGATRLRMADILRIGLDRVLDEFERTGGVDVRRPGKAFRKEARS